MTTKTKTTCVRDKASAKAWRTMPVTDLFDKLPVGKRYDQRTVFPYGKVPVIDQGKSGVIGYHNEEPGIRASEEKPIVTFANHTCQVTLQKRNFSVIQNVFPLKAKEGVDPWFLYYRIRDAIKFQEYKGHWPDFVMLQFLVPPHNEQKRIAEVLSAFDEKIENNNRIIKALDETAQAIFKEWFVKFRFPGYEKVKLVDSELGEIPKGWEVKRLGDLGKIVTGKTPSTKDKANFGNIYPFVTIPDLQNGMFVMSTERFLSEQGGESMRVSKLPAGAICVSCIATVGLVGITTQKDRNNQQINSVLPD